jgi:hypothetical protein
VNASVSENGVRFDDFRRLAQLVYRRQDKRAIRSLPLAPGKGLPKVLRESVENTLKNTSSNTRKVDIVWDQFDTEDLFALDRERKTIRLNKSYRGIVTLRIKRLPGAATEFFG